VDHYKHEQRGDGKASIVDRPSPLVGEGGADEVRAG
jgi:hypothetical protein